MYVHNDIMVKFYNLWATNYKLFTLQIFTNLYYKFKKYINIG